MMNFDSAANFLEEYLDNLQRVNSQYSLRAFSKKLQVSSGKLSEYISGKRKISFKTALKIADKLQLTENEKNDFLCLVIRAQNIKENLSGPFEMLSSSKLKIMKDWEYFAILSLFDTCEDKIIPSVEWASKRLGVEPTKMQLLFERLEQLEYIKVLSDGIKCLKNGICTTDNLLSTDLSESHKQTLYQTITKIDEVQDLELRDISSITMAIDPSKLPAAKKMIKEFRRNLMTFMEEGKQEEVYNLNIQLVPVSRKIQ